MKKQIGKHFLASLAGLLVPVCFIYMDLSELGLELTLSNAKDVYLSQRIYPFSSVIFPAIFFCFSLLLHTIVRQKKFYQALLNGLRNQIAVVTPEARVVFTNKAMNEARDTSAIADILKSVERESVWREGTVSYAVSISEFNGFVLLNLKDISAIIERDKLISQQKSQLIENEHFASLGIMASGIAHEINNPLAIIQGNLFMLSEELAEQGLPEPVQIKKIEKMIFRITQIINTMKELSRRETSSVRDILSISDVLESVLDFCQVESSTDNRHEVEVRLQDFPQDHCIYANESQLSQILLNLIHNAQDESAKLPGGWVEVSAVSSGEWLEIRVTNSGPKLHEDMREKIFTPFFTTKSPGRGTGLGLSICKSLAKNNAGDLDLDLEGTYTCFVLRLPLLKAQAA